jgi:2-polyprenyl-3-methyl-5-hydroxy-6-metoxy-1,4-benzoquinol methylase
VDTSVLPLGRKPEEYFQHSRADVVARLPRPLGRVLDVGCGVGNVGRELRAQGADRLVGIELDREAAKRAEDVFDRVFAFDALAAVEQLGNERFDTIVCYDIVEHLYDPAALLEALRQVAAPTGRLHISIPNARHASLLRDLYLKGTFGYETSGHRDSTHIRWFTRRDITRLVEECGWRVDEVATHEFKPYRQLLTTLTGGALRELFAVQWFLLARV